MSRAIAEGDGTTCIWAAQPAVAALRNRGIDAAPVLRAAGLSPSALDNIEARLPFRAVAELWDAAAVAARDPFFGVHVAETAPRGSGDVLEYLGCTSKTLGEAYERIARYARLFYDLANLMLIVEPQQARLVQRSRLPAAQYHEFIYGYFVVRGRQWTATNWRPRRVTFQHAPPSGRREPPSLFACPVDFSAVNNEVRMPRDVLALPHLHADSRLLDILLRYADTQLAAIPERGDIVATVASSIARQLASTLPTLASTAAALGMSPRTLQRRLADEGLTHRLLLDEIRRGLALKYIVDPGLSVAEIGYLLHFSDGTAFYRAFKRWTGESPLQYRARTLFR